MYDVGNSKSEIENVMAGSVARRFQSPVEDVARKVVREALSRWPRSNLCVGSQSSVMWAASTFLWVGFLVSSKAGNRVRKVTDLGIGLAVFVPVRIMGGEEKS